MQTNIKENRPINIAKIIEERNSEVLNKLPGVAIKLLSKIVREKELNRILSKYSNDMGIDFIVKMMKEFNLQIDVRGIENLPDNANCIFVANHPFGIIDGLVLTRIISEKYGSLKAIANDAFLLIPQMHPFIAVVNVFGNSSKAYVKSLDDVYKSGVPVTHFPAGEVSRRYKRVIEDQAWAKSFVTKAVQHKRDIVPICFEGSNSSLFNNLFVARQLLGIKANIELILLPREMFKKRNKTIIVKIGKPIPYQTFDTSLSHSEWAQKVRSRVYELKSMN